MRFIWPWRRDNSRAVQAALAVVLMLGLGPVYADTSEPWFRGVASAVIPGAGQAGNGDYGAAALHFGIFAVSVYGVLRYQDKNDYLDTDKRYDEGNNREFINKTTLRYDYAARLATDVTLYSGYAAYRDARQRDNSGFRTPAPRESLSDLAVAPFSFNYLSRPTTAKRFPDRRRRGAALLDQRTRRHLGHPQRWQRRVAADSVAVLIFKGY